LAGARALIGSRAGIAAGGHFAARPELGGAGFSGLRCASGMCHLRAHRNRARAASPSGISEAVPWVPSCRRGWRCACGARWLQRSDGRKTGQALPPASSGRPMECTPSELRSFRMRTSFRNVPHVKMILAAGPHGPTFIPGGHVEAPSLISRDVTKRMRMRMRNGLILSTIL